MARKKLHLVVTHRWYDEWLNGDKDEEYRNITARYIKMFDKVDLVTEDWDLVLHRGYTSTTQTYPIEELYMGYGKTEWGAPANKTVFVIKCKKTLNR